jgi:uncharacterized protein YecT (DUF1311 family)
MRRHSQNISFLAIIATLMSCAFFFSQKNNSDNDSADTVQLASVNASQVESVVDIPDCSSERTSEDQLKCLSQAVDASDDLLDSKLNLILDQMSDSDLRIKLVESQMNWEESRDADCAFVRGLEGDADLVVIDEKKCLQEANLERLDYLNILYCDLNPDADCPADMIP